MCRTASRASYNWAALALLPPYILRPLAVIALMGGAWLAGLPADAVIAIAIAAIALWLTALGQTLLLNRRLRRIVEPGERRYAAKDWVAVSVPMFAIDGLYCLLMYIDVLMLKAFVTPEDIGIYYAASKTLSLIVFVHFAVTSATAHRFSEYHVGGDRERLRAFLRDAVRWTFWPSLAAAMAFLALGWPLLSLFGKTFVSGYPLMFIFAVGLLARAAIGPAGRFPRHARRAARMRLCRGRGSRDQPRPQSPADPAVRRDRRGGRAFKRLCA
ncbi:MAG: hypothetical protein M5U33_12310 [Pseudorhodoplanes sp.]|nr:hypothetical protein [Pseudorhodoplanes sp.]